MPKHGAFLQPLTAAEASLVDGEGAPGLLVVFDLVDSTARKRLRDVPWLRDTALVYRAFQRWIVAVRRALGVKGPTHAKLIGDALMLFVPLREPADAAQRFLFLQYIQAFRSEVHLDASKLLAGVRLKTVVASLANVCEVGGERLGRGLDFAFRLEKKAAADRVVVNLAFARGLDPAGLRALGLRAFRRQLHDAKGFRKREPFVALLDRS